jgi:hypothetical protein
MDSLDTTSPLLPLPDGMVIASLLETEGWLVVQVGFRDPIVSCSLSRRLAYI